MHSHSYKWKVILYLACLLFLISSVSGCTSKGLTTNDLPLTSSNNVLSETENENTTDTIDTTQSVKEKSENTSVSDIPLRVHYIDVGQGDSEFIELPNGKTILIDAGIPSAASIVSSLVTSLGYSKIDYVVATHPHNDHIGGMPIILNKYTIGTFFMPDKEHTTDIFMSMLTALKNNGCKAEYAKSGKVFIEEAGIKAEFLAPVNSNYSDLNNYSAVLKLTYNNSSFLFTGDAEDVSEQEMISSGINLKADVLKVGHHGSSYSCTSAFLSKVVPKYAIISVGNNSYGHPTNDTLQKLASLGVSVYRTDVCGTITVETDGNTYTIDKNAYAIQNNAPPEEESSSSITSDNSTSDIIVYKTNKGSCYHMDGCSYLKSRIQTTVNDAKADGLRPCSRCHPPQ